MTPNDLRMIADFLEHYADMLGDQVCNDSWLPDTDENWQLIDSIQKWNSDDPNDWDTRKQRTSIKGLSVFNSSVPAFLAYKIRKELGDEV